MLHAVRRSATSPPIARRIIRQRPTGRAGEEGGESGGINLLHLYNLLQALFLPS